MHTAAIDIAESGALLTIRAAHVQIDAAIGLDEKHGSEAAPTTERTPEPRLTPSLGALIIQRQPECLGLATQRPVEERAQLTTRTVQASLQRAERKPQAIRRLALR